MKHQEKGFAPIGMVEYWNNGIPGLEILVYLVNGYICFDD
jgi:hypothetical protein